MALKTIVKVGNITNLSDARYCAGMGAEMLGFQVVEGHEHYISPKAFQEIRGWVTGPKIVAEIYGLQKAEDLAEILENYRPDLLECSQAELSLIEHTLSLPFILKTDDVKFETNAQYLLLSQTPEDAERNILVMVSDRNEAEKIHSEHPTYGFALQGEIEEKVGLKDLDKLAEILEMLEED
jgi:phosphoribosylanthranilate isomerase